VAAIASDKPAPAGGSAAAAAVVLAAALLEKAAKLSVRHWDGAGAVGERARSLRLQSEELIEADVHAYLGFVEAVRSAKGMDAEGGEDFIGPARARTVEVPLAIVRAAAEVAGLVTQMIVHGNPNLRSDAEVAGVLAAAGARAATLTMAANLADEPKDRRLTEAKRLAKAAGAWARLGSSGALSGSPRPALR
jgi:formiminotetrahydrofolate cyclodeaminase